MSTDNEAAVYFTTGAGNTGPYSFVLDYGDSSEIKGIAQEADDTIVSLTTSSVDTANDTVTFTTSVQSGAVLAVYRDTPQTQSAQFRRSGDFTVLRHDDAINKLFYILQRLWHDMEKAAVLRPVQVGFDPQLPYDLTQEGEGGLIVNADGNGWGIADDVKTIGEAGAAAAAAAVSAADAATDAGDTATLASAAASSASDASTDETVIVAIASTLEVAITDLGTAGGNASISGTYLVQPSSGAVTVTLVSPTGGETNGVCTVKNSSDYQEQVVIDTDTAATIDGYSEVHMWHPGQSLTFGWDGSNWHIISEHNDIANINFPKLEHVDDDTFNVIRKQGQLDFVSAQLQDGRIWHYDGSTLTIDLDTTALLGLDEGTRQTNTWYYTYLVPDGTNWRTLSAVISDNDPDTGPTGYDMFAYVGAVRTEESDTPVIPFVQTGNTFYIHANQQWKRIESIAAKTTEQTQWLAMATAIGPNIWVPATYSYVLIASASDGSGGVNTYHSAALTTSDTGSAPIWTPLTGTPANAKANSANMSRDNDGSATHNWIPASETNYLYWAYTLSGGGAIKINMCVAGWKDGYLPQ